MTEFASLLRDVGAVPVLRAPRLGDVAAIVSCLVDAGLPVVELTATTADAFNDIERAVRIPGAVIGLGSVITAAQRQRAEEAGAHFTVSPVMASSLIDGAQRPVVLAGMTPTEIAAAHAATGEPVKLFPAGTVGPDHVRAIHGPLPDIPLLVSGGLTVDDLAMWFEAGALAVNLGTDVAPADVLARADVAELSRRARRVRTTIDELRGSRV